MWIFGCVYSARITRTHLVLCVWINPKAESNHFQSEWLISKFCYIWTYAQGKADWRSILRIACFVFFFLSILLFAVDMNSLYSEMLFDVNLHRIVARSLARVCVSNAHSRLYFGDVWFCNRIVEICCVRFYEGVTRSIYSSVFMAEIEFLRWRPLHCGLCCLSSNICVSPRRV